MNFSKTRSIIKPIVQAIFNNHSIEYCQFKPHNKEYVVTILDACTKIGQVLSLLLKQLPLIGELRLYDKNATTVANLAEGLSHIDTRTELKSFGGKQTLKYAVTVSNSFKLVNKMILYKAQARSIS